MLVARVTEECLSFAFFNDSVGLSWHWKAVLVEVLPCRPLSNQIADWLVQTQALALTYKELVGSTLFAFTVQQVYSCSPAECFVRNTRSNGRPAFVHTAPRELPDTEGARSSTVTLHPARSSACAADRPPMDPPMTSALMRFVILMRGVCRTLTRTKSQMCLLQ